MTITINSNTIIINYPGAPTNSEEFPKDATKIDNEGDHVYLNFNGEITDIHYKDVTSPTVTSGINLFNLLNA